MCEKECFSAVNIPPEGIRVSFRNCGRSNSCSVWEDSEDLAQLRSMEEKLEDIGFGAGGHSVMSVASATAYNLATEMIGADLVGPECSIMSGRLD